MPCPYQLQLGVPDCRLLPSINQSRSVLPNRELARIDEAEWSYRLTPVGAPKIQIDPVGRANDALIRVKRPDGLLHKAAWSHYDVRQFHLLALLL
jgi:hypothetical protein